MCEEYERSSEEILRSNENSDYSNFVAWKCLLDARLLILEGMHLLVGNGSKINFWTFNSCYPFPLYNLVPDHQKALLDFFITVDLVISNSH